MLKVIWIDGLREPTQPSNPKYPNGIDLDVTGGVKPFCHTFLEYPAPRCGHFKIICGKCNRTLIVTTAGRKDDPRSIKIPCDKDQMHANTGVVARNSIKSSWPYS